MKKSKTTSITWIILLSIILILCLVFWLKWNKKSEWNFAIIPHFMLDNGKVDQFYNFLKTEYYLWWNPEKIVLISPNHFHTNTKEIQTICKTKNNSNFRLKILIKSENKGNIGLQPICNCIFCLINWATTDSQSFQNFSSLA